MLKIEIIMVFVADLCYGTLLKTSKEWYMSINYIIAQIVYVKSVKRM